MKFLEVEVPNADEYQIDNFLGNIIQYKINEEWHYFTQVELPVNNLVISEVKKSEDKTWLKIQVFQ